MRTNRLDQFASPPRCDRLTGMEHDALIQLARQLVSGDLSPQDFLQLAAPDPNGLAEAHQDTARSDTAVVDLDRPHRCGFPEVIFGQGKPAESIIQIAVRLLEHGNRVLATRVEQTKADAILGHFPDACYNRVARTVRIDPRGPESAGRQRLSLVGQVAVITAGTSDRSVAEEACETLDWMGVASTLIQDVGVAGPHRLPERLAEFASADAIVVVAGMEGALPSIVGGYVRAPIFAVPTSVGYGANLGGMAALLAMLNCCAANVAVVNIDAGFKAGYLAGLVASRRSED